MSAKIHHLYGEGVPNVIAYAPEDVAKQFEQLAEDVRAGRILVRIGLVMYEHPDCDSVGYRPIGEPSNVMETLGMMAFAKHHLLNND